MLELKNITKIYPAGDGEVHALKGINLTFRKNEFVSILGQSGCGKTTMLNIVGGLDHYTNGDLIINGKSTKDFNERDWDAYRNHSIGFVFQSYNLIPHQSVLQNVELALALSGISKSERRKRAKQALASVGLSSQINKKPSEMSGGQMQRVAIARALVNNPDIILADEPTGALDSETSIQVMEILKEVARDRLVIMVTHNPDLADQYSTRIIRMLDGLIISDSNPLNQDELNEIKLEKDYSNLNSINLNLYINKDEKDYESKIKIFENGEVINQKDYKKKKDEKIKKPSMSFFTSFALSLKNLFTKKGRTILTSFAGSIGIIGIALIFAVSQGMTNYINIVQEETLSSYPLTIRSEHTDMNSLLQAFLDAAQSSSSEDRKEDHVYEQEALYDLINAINSANTSQNDLKSFKEYIDKEIELGGEESELARALSGIQYTYDFDMLVYTKNADGQIMQSDTQKIITEMLAKFMGSSSMMGGGSSIGSSPMSSLMGGSSGSMGFTLWQEILSGDNGNLINPMVSSQYDVIYGSWPNSYDEVVIVVDSKNRIDDVTLYALGFKSEDDIDKIVDAAISGEKLPDKETWNISFEDICKKEYKTVINAACYSYDEKTGNYIDLRTSPMGLEYLYNNAINLRVSGIVRAKPDSLSSMLTGSICYTKALTEKVIEDSKTLDAINAQINNPETDIFTGLPFKNSAGLSNKEKQDFFLNHVNNASIEEKADIYVKIMSIPPQEFVDTYVNQTIESMGKEQILEMLVQGMVAQTGMSEDEIRAYLEKMDEEVIDNLIRSAIEEQIRDNYAKQVENQLSSMPKEHLAMALDYSLANYTEEQCALYYDEVLTFSDSDYETNLSILGYVDIDNPSTVNMYVSTFDDKGVLENEIKKYNEMVSEEKQIAYTDYVGLMMSSITTIIDAITYVLIAFVAVSLVVSSIMIGVITLISVQERTKEIGILRALGASKRNVSSMFNAETLIIGFTSGALGIGVTYLLCIPINIILHILTGINNLSAYLPPVVGIILILISMGLTLISGIIPSRSAAKKDPVVALRTE